MMIPPPSRTLGASLFAAALLSACAPESTTASGESAASGEEPTAQSAPVAIVIAQSAWLSVSEDGAVFTTFLDPDGRYRDLRDGKIAFAGAWEQNAQGQVCFTPDAGAGECWEYGAPNKQGVMRATDIDGRAIELKRISYVPPVDPADDSAESAGTGGD